MCRQVANVAFETWPSDPVRSPDKEQGTLSLTKCRSFVSLNPKRPPYCSNHETLCFVLLVLLRGGVGKMFATAVRFLAKKAKKSKPANLNIGLEGQQWSGTLRQIVKEEGPLTVASFWEHAQTSGIRSKRHMKIILKWMRGQNHVKLICNHLGDRQSPTEKEFMYTYVSSRSERLAAKEAEESTFRPEGDNIPSSADTPPADATTLTEDQAPRGI